MDFVLIQNLLFKIVLTFINRVEGVVKGFSLFQNEQGSCSSSCHKATT